MVKLKINEAANKGEKQANKEQSEKIGTFKHRYA